MDGFLEEAKEPPACLIHVGKEFSWQRTECVHACAKAAWTKKSPLGASGDRSASYVNQEYSNNRDFIGRFFQLMRAVVVDLPTSIRRNVFA